MGRALILSVRAIFLASAMCLVVDSTAVSAGGNCQSKLVGNAYDCTVEFSEFATQNDCFDFRTGGLSQNFDLVIDNGPHYGCACDTTGSFKSPSFDSSLNSFHCLSSFEGFQYNGKVKAQKLSGHGTDEGGVSLIFSCTKRSSPCP